jgi:hypothetical protein
MNHVLNVRIEGAVARLTLNRPDKLNALSNEMLEAIIRTLDRIELDAAVRAVVITGTGRAFSAGADIAAFQSQVEAGPAEAVAHFVRPGHRMTRRVESFPKPVIAAVNGIAFGGGCELVESTHIALAADTAVFSKAEINNLWRHAATAPQYRPEGRDGADPHGAAVRCGRGGPAWPGEPRIAKRSPPRRRPCSRGGTRDEAATDARSGPNCNPSRDGCFDRRRAGN